MKDRNLTVGLHSCRALSSLDAGRVSVSFPCEVWWSSWLSLPPELKIN